MRVLPFVQEEKLGANYYGLRVLGRGGEGTVYRVREKATGEELVLKVFHEPIEGTSGYGLRVLADRTTSNKVGLARITLVEDADKILAVRYPFVRLHQIHWRVLSSCESIAQAMFAAFCRLQNYLMLEHRIGLLDPTAEHFMLSKDGTFHFIDFGFAIKSVDHPGVLDQGRFGYGFAMLLLSIYHKNLKLEILPTSGYSYQTPCPYCVSKGLDEIATQYGWVREILTEVRSQNASIFLDAEFYQRLGERFPNRVPFPQLVTLSSKSLEYLAQVRRFKW